MKTIQFLAIAGMLAFTGMACAPTADAQRTTVVIRTAPPAPRVERVVVRKGYVWRPGYWRWNGRKYIWVGGRHYRMGPGRNAWVPGHYRATAGGWVYVPGHWR